MYDIIYIINKYQELFNIICMRKVLQVSDKNE